MFLIRSLLFLVFFFNDTATTEIYTSIDTLSLHDALPISRGCRLEPPNHSGGPPVRARSEEHTSELQSPIDISYAVFCLKKKKTTNKTIPNYLNIKKKNTYKKTKNN